MAGRKALLSEDTVIVKRPYPLDKEYPIILADYERFFKNTIGSKVKEKISDMWFGNWINLFVGLTLKEALVECLLQLEEHDGLQKPNNMEDLLTQRRFSYISDTDKE